MDSDIDKALRQWETFVAAAREQVFRNIWLPYALSPAEYEAAQKLALPVLQELYVGVWACGPDYMNMRAFDVLLVNMLGTIEDTHQAAQFMNRFRAAHMRVPGLLTRVHEDEFEMLNHYLREGTVDSWQRTEPFFQIYPHPDIFLTSYHRAASLTLLRHHYLGQEEAAEVYAVHDRFIASMEQTVQASSLVPRSRARMRLVTGTTSEA